MVVVLGYYKRNENYLKGNVSSSKMLWYMVFVHVFYRNASVGARFCILFCLFLRERRDSASVIFGEGFRRVIRGVERLFRILQEMSR